MQALLPFREVLEVVDSVPLEEQEELMAVVGRRLIERRRLELANEIAEAETEYDSGSCETRTPEELMREILS